MKPSNWISAAIAAIATAILPGCDTAVLQEIKPGITTAVEVRARMGNPGFEFRNEDGSVGVVPDSLISEFTTKKGRKVYDGGGVAPDVKFENETMSSLTTALYTKFMIFDFATKYSNENASIPSPEEFEVSDEIYNQFISFVKGNNFTYESESQEELDDLIEHAKKDKYYSLAQSEFDALKAKLAPDFDKDSKAFSEEIKDLLQDEIVSRYYYQKGAIRAAVHDDKGIKKAIDELNSETAYAGYFKPGKIISAN